MTQFSVFLLLREKSLSLLLFTFVLPGVVSGSEPDSRPQFVWQGELGGTHDLVLRKATAVVEDMAGPSVTGISYRFTAPLPEEGLAARVSPLTSRGYVHIVQQPTMENSYTLRIRIEDRQDGTSLYRIAVNWNVEGPDMSWQSLHQPHKAKKSVDAIWVQGNQPLRISCHAIWTGAVQSAARLAISGNEARVVQGQVHGDLVLTPGTTWPKGSYHPVAMPTSPETTAKIIELPARENAYTLIIDLGASSSQVVIEIAW